MSLNKVQLIGNVGKDPDVRYLDNGVAVATFPLATTDRAYTLANGTQVPERTEWHNIVLWRGLAETAEKYVHKGDKLYIEGKIRSRSYDDQNGIKRYIVEILPIIWRCLLRVQLRLARHNSQCSRVSLLSSLHRHKRYKRLTLPMICRSKAECSFSVSGICLVYCLYKIFRQYRLAAKEKKEN